MSPKAAKTWSCHLLLSVKLTCHSLGLAGHQEDQEHADVQAPCAELPAGLSLFVTVCVLSTSEPFEHLLPSVSHHHCRNLVLL